MGLLYPTYISFRKHDVVILWPSILWGWMFHMDTIDLPVIRLLQRLVWPSWYKPSCYRSYLPFDLLWKVSSVILGIIMGFTLIEVGDPSWRTFKAFLVGSALLSTPSNHDTRQYNGRDLYGNSSTSSGHTSLTTYSTSWATSALVHPLSAWGFCSSA